MAAAVRLPKRRHAEETEPNPEGLGIRRWAPGQAPPGPARRQGRSGDHRRGAPPPTWGGDDQPPTPKGCLTSSKPGWRGAMEERHARGYRSGVRAEPVGRRDRHAEIPLEGPWKYAAVQNPPGAGTLNEGEATMGHCPPHMVPRGARPAVVQWSEDVRACTETRIDFFFLGKRLYMHKAVQRQSSIN